MVAVAFSKHMKSQPTVSTRGEIRSKIRGTARLDSLAPCPGKRKARGLHRDVRVMPRWKRQGTRVLLTLKHPGDILKENRGELTP